MTDIVCPAGQSDDHLYDTPGGDIIRLGDTASEFARPRSGHLPNSLGGQGLADRR